MARYPASWNRNRIYGISLLQSPSFSYDRFRGHSVNPDCVFAVYIVLLSILFKKLLVSNLAQPSRDVASLKLTEGHELWAGRHRVIWSPSAEGGRNEAPRG